MKKENGMTAFERCNKISRHLAIVWIDLALSLYYFVDGTFSFNFFSADKGTVRRFVLSTLDAFFRRETCKFIVQLKNANLSNF
jgi:hypothetical protein